MKNLLSDLEASAGKIAYQTYTVMHGIEKIEVLVPLKEAAKFEANMNRDLPTRQSVLEVLTAHGGLLK